MAITPTDFEKIWSSNATTPAYTFNDADYLEGWDFVGNLPPTRAQWNAIQKRTDEKMKYVFDNFGAPLIAPTVADMTLQNRVYVYTGSEVGYTAGHWYYYDAGTSAWVDGGVYNAVVVQTDTTLTQAGVPADAKATGEKLSNVFDDLELDVPVINAQMVGVDNSNYYINASGVVTYLSSSTYHVVQYAVQKDVTYYLKGTDVRLNTSVPLACFSTNPVASNLQTDETIITGSKVPSTYDSQYAPSSDGYILIAYVEGCAELNLYDSVLTSKRLKDIEHNLVEVNDSLGEYVIVPDEEQTGTDTPNKYINASGVIGNASSSKLHVLEYPVTQGIQYVLHGNGVSLMAGFPLAIFGLEPLATNTGNNTILLNGSKVATNYNVTYTAPSDGYIFIAYYEQGGQLKLYSTKYDSKRLIDIENGQGTVKTPIKIQLFGDSITDDVRVNEGQEINITTWANFIDDYMANYDVTLINSAVGGSGIGHGKSSTARYSTKTYNYVHDLVTDGTLVTDCDIIVMLIGTNNWRGEGGGSFGTLGQLGDNTVSTFYGALNLICQYISEHTESLFVLATPPQRYNSADSESPTNALGEVLNGSNHTLKQYAQSMKEVGALYGFPVINLNDDLGWNKYNVNNYTSDGLHPSASECYRIAQFICGVLKEHIGNNESCKALASVSAFLRGKQIERHS